MNFSINLENAATFATIYTEVHLDGDDPRQVSEILNE